MSYAVTHAAALYCKMSQALDVPADKTVKLAASINNSTGWVALGIPSEPGTMPGTTAVIATTSAGPSGVGIYSINARTVPDTVLLSSGDDEDAPAGDDRARGGSGPSTRRRHLLNLAEQDVVDSISDVCAHIPCA